MTATESVRKSAGIGISQRSAFNYLAKLLNNGYLIREGDLYKMAG